MDTQKRTRLIAFSGAAIGLICLEIGRRTRYGDTIISLAFLAFFAWIGMRLWLRQGGKDDAQ